MQKLIAKLLITTSLLLTPLTPQLLEADSLGKVADTDAVDGDTMSQTIDPGGNSRTGE